MDERIMNEDQQIGYDIAQTHFKQQLRQKLAEVEKEVWGKDELVRWEKVKELIGGMCK